jgi:hypothetical protein
MKFFFTVSILLSASLAAMSHDGVDSQLHWKDTSPSTSASQNTQELQAHDESRENHNIDDSAFPKVLPNAIEDDTYRDHHPISTENYLPRMTTQGPKLNNNNSAFHAHNESRDNHNNNNSAFLKVLLEAIEDDAHRDHHPISTKNHLPRMTTQEPKLNNNDYAFPKVLPNVIKDDAHSDHHPISTKNHLPRMTTQEPKLDNNDSAFPKVLPNIIEDDAHSDHHPISTKNHLPRMTTQEPKLDNDDSAFPEVLPNVIKDDAHSDHHPISINTIPSESSDQGYGYGDTSLTSSSTSTFLDQGYDVAPHASSSTEATYQGHGVASHRHTSYSSTSISLYKGRAGTISPAGSKVGETEYGASS